MTCYYACRISHCLDDKGNQAFRLERKKISTHIIMPPPDWHTVSPNLYSTIQAAEEAAIWLSKEPIELTLPKRTFP